MWQLMVERWNAHIRSRTAGLLLGPLQCDLSGDLLAKLEAFERNLSQNGQLRRSHVGQCAHCSGEQS